MLNSLISLKIPHMPQLIAAEGDDLDGAYGSLGDLGVAWPPLRQKDIDGARLDHETASPQMNGTKQSSLMREPKRRYRDGRSAPERAEAGGGDAAGAEHAISDDMVRMTIQVGRPSVGCICLQKDPSFGISCSGVLR